MLSDTEQRLSQSKVAANRVAMAESATTTLENARRIARVLGLLNESKNLGKITYAMPRMLTWQGVEPAYLKNAERVAFRASRDQLAKAYVKKMKGLFRKARTVGVPGVEHDLRTLVQDTFKRSRELGFSAIGRAAAWDKFDLSTIKAAAEEEMKYTKKFLGDYMNDRGTMPYERRFNQYGSTVNHQFNMAAYQGVPHGTLIFWEMTSFEPCPDCPELAARSPYTTDLGNHPLPTVPQAGDTRCLGDCKCYLRYEYKPFPLGTEPHMSYEVDTFNGSRVDLRWIKSKQGKLVQRDLNRMYRREAHHRQMMEALPHDTDAWRYHHRMRNEWRTRLVDYKNQHGIRGVPRTNVSDYLNPANNLLNNGFNTFMGPARYEGTGAILRGLGVTPGELKSITKTQVRVKLKTGKVQTYSHGDEAGASLWTKAPYCQRSLRGKNIIFEAAAKCVPFPKGGPTPRLPAMPKAAKPVSDLPAELTAAEKAAIKKSAWKPAQTWHARGMGYGEEAYRDTLNSLHYTLRISDKSFKIHQKMIKDWARGTFSEGAGALRHLSGRTTVFRHDSTLGYADKDKALLNAIKVADKEDFVALCRRYGVSEIEVRKAVAVDQYLTQQVLKEYGILSGEKLTIYRGVAADYLDVQGAAIKAGTSATVQTNSLSSWTLNKTHAQYFAQADGLVLKRTVKRESVSFTGLSFSASEKEIVLKGANYKVRVLKSKRVSRDLL